MDLSSSIIKLTLHEAAKKFQAVANVYDIQYLKCIKYYQVTIWEILIKLFFNHGD